MLLFPPAPTAAVIADGSVSDGQQVHQVAGVAARLGKLGTATVLAGYKPRRIGWWPRR